MAGDSRHIFSKKLEEMKTIRDNLPRQRHAASHAVRRSETYRETHGATQRLTSIQPRPQTRTRASVRFEKVMLSSSYLLTVMSCHVVKE